MILLLDAEGRLSPRRPRIADRLRSRLAARDLDRQLAGGASPDRTVELALRAQALLRPAERRHLARSLERLLAASAATGPHVLPVPFCRRAVREAGGEIRALIECLHAGSLEVDAVARVATLLTDGSGPLYRGTGHDLRRELGGPAATPRPIAS